jgi:hypothetical protein
MERCAYDVWFGWIENKRPMDAPMVASLGVVNAVAASLKIKEKGCPLWADLKERGCV